jgi:hypothetical protein
MKKIIILLLVLLVAGFIMMSCEQGDLDDACKNMVKLMYGEKPDGMDDAEWKKQQDESLKECKAEFKGEPASLINCVAKAKTFEDLQKCEQK